MTIASKDNIFIHIEQNQSNILLVETYYSTRNFSLRRSFKCYFQHKIEMTRRSSLRVILL